jgi:hypothetical protein
MRTLLARQALDHRAPAEELRTAGENTRNHEARRALLSLARDADEMAARIRQTSASSCLVHE